MTINTNAILDCPSVGVYATEMAQLGLPIDGLSMNRLVLHNHHDRVGYLATLSDDQKIIFLAHILRKAFELGQEMTQEDDDEDEDLI